MVSEIGMLPVIFLSGYVSISALLLSITMFYSSAYFSLAQNFQMRTENTLTYMEAHSPSYSVSKAMSLIMFLSDIFLFIMSEDNVYPKFTSASVIDQLGSIKYSHYVRISP